MMFVCLVDMIGASRPQDQRRISDDRAQRMDENWKTAQALPPPKWTAFCVKTLAKPRKTHVKKHQKGWSNWDIHQDIQDPFLGGMI